MTLYGPALEGTVLALETTRVAGALVAAPLAWEYAPGRVRAALALGVALCAHGAAPHAPVESVGQAVGAAPLELLVGVAIGLVVRAAVSVVEIAGEAMAPVMGLGAATLLDPRAAEPETGLARLLRILALLLAVLIGAHRVVLGGAIESFRVLPAGSAADPSLAAPVLVRLTAEAIGSGIRIAVPVLAVLVLVQIALAFVSRAAPAMQVFSIGLGVSILAGGATLFFALPDMAAEVAGEMSAVGGRIETVLLALTGG